MIEFGHRRDGIEPHEIALDDDRRGRGEFAALQRMVDAAHQAVVCVNRDGDAKALLQLAQMRALLVKDIERHHAPGARCHVELRVADQRILDHPQHVQGHGSGGANGAGAVAMGADDAGAFKHAGAHALARHFEQAKMRDAANLNAGAVVLERFLDATLDGAVVAVLLHVDEIDHDEARKVAQSQLPRDFVRCFKIGAKRSVFDIVLAGRAARVHVNRDQRFGLVDDDVAARFQRYLRGEHRIELGLDAHMRKQRLGLGPGFDVAHVAGAQHTHVIARFLEALRAGDDNLVDLLAVKVADRALDERAFLINEAGRTGFKRQRADGFPHAQEIFKIATHFRLGAGGAGGAQNNAHALGHLQLGGDFLEALAVVVVGDLAGNAAAARGVGHQHRIAASQRQISRERSAFVAALFLHNLHEQNLTAADDFLNLVLLALTNGAHRHFFKVVAAKLLDVLFLVVAFAVLVVLVVLVFILVVVFGRGGNVGAGSDGARLFGVALRSLLSLRNLSLIFLSFILVDRRGFDHVRDGRRGVERGPDLWLLKS